MTLLHRFFPLSSFYARALVVCIVFSLIPLSSAFALERSTGRILQDDGAALADDFGEIFSFPVRFDGSDWALTGAVIGAAAASMLWADRPVRDYAFRHRTPFLDRLLPVGDFYGKLSTGIYLGSALYTAGIISDDESLRLTGRAVIEAHTFSLLITGVMKAVAGRSRPYTGDGNNRFNWVETSNLYWSLPSGHATSAFAVSSALSQRIDRPLASVGLYALSCVTVLNRIYDDKHWLSDTLLGAAIGTAVGVAVGNMINKEEDENCRFIGTPVQEKPVELVRIIQWRF
ncbi:MAG: PA-phosphatase [Prosthecochloris sp.]|nr:PA-phosphatase [Prosthecochloris sp.]